MIFKSNFFRDINKEKKSLEQRKQLVDSFPEPADDIDRTAFQYACKFDGARKGKMFLFNAAAFVAIPCLLLLYLINRVRCREKEHHDAVLISERFLSGMDYQDKLPPQLVEEFGQIHPLDFTKYPELFRGVLDGKTLKYFLKSVLRRPFQCFMHLMCLAHMGGLNRILLEYTPVAVLNYVCEFNMASSMLTAVCENHGCEYICFQHGDYLTDEGRAFVRYSRLYLWDEHYRDLFNWSRSPEEQYRFYRPKMYDLNLPELDHEPEYYISYYFSGNDDSAQLILDVFKKCVAQGKKCKVRPHPRYTDIPYIKKVFEPEGIFVEAPLEMKLEESVANSQCVAALCSTVLTQAYYAGKEVFIDDISNPAFYEDVKKGMHIMTNKPHRLLSEL